jgi:hypothetical protein
MGATQSSLSGAHRLMGAMGEICDNMIEHSQAALLLF